MAVSSSIQTYHLRRTPISVPCSILRPITKRNQLIGKFGGIRSVKFSYSGGNSNFLGKKINVWDEPDSSEIEASNAANNKAFVHFFREAWPYFLAHRGSTFVVMISAEIVDSPHLEHILTDISLLHELGIKFVLVPGTHVQIDRLLNERKCEAKYVGSYRVTDCDSLKAAIDAALSVEMMIKAKLSAGPSLSAIRRHGDNSGWYDGVCVATGNFVAAKRRVVEGIDYGSTGEVKKINDSCIRERLNEDCIVIISNLGHSSSGEVLNCNTYEVATAAACTLNAEKLICIIDGPILDENNRLIRFLTLQDADMLIRRRAKQSETAANYVKAVDGVGTSLNGKASKWAPIFQNGVVFDNWNGLCPSEQGFAIGGQERLNRSNCYLSELAAATFVCRNGVKRVHLLDGTIGGVLLKELFQRDGVGTMVASDLYEGIRMARVTDLNGIKQLLLPLEESRTLLKRTEKELLKILEYCFIVAERDGHVVACSAFIPLFEGKCGEIAVIAVSPECRRQGLGYKLLDYIEKKASSLGLQVLFLLTTGSADWFIRRGFSECAIQCIPEERRKKINISRGSKCYMKGVGGALA